MKQLFCVIALTIVAGLSVACDDSSTTTPTGDVATEFRDATPADSDPTDGTSVDTSVEDAGDDVLEDTAILDTDDDGIPDEVDNCANVANLDQADLDIDGRGDVCDGDIDGDGIPNVVDLDPVDPNFPGRSPLGAVFGHSSTTLYTLNTETYEVVTVGPFGWPADATSNLMTDLAVDQFGVMFGISYEDVFTCHPVTAVCTRLAALPEQFNGLTVVPLGTISNEQEALVGISNSGNWVWIQVSGTTTLTPIGNYGGDYTSSGDAFSIAGEGTFASVNKGTQVADVIAEIDPATGQVIREVGTLQVGDAWGLAGWTGRVFAFDYGGSVTEIDISTGTSSVVANTNIEWWGAGVGTVKN